ncbi:NADH-quinone oxidoreductase subunit E [Actibacterium sp. 188UL27-1]|uniref:NADH-quinone oxidoreductase subunit E n=1 Tax=Actibacterium sp. 188UL27-1 TaxID=2786961 RepID=UPI0019596E62|nr:NADH-quinone oxidoreductase subunit E [Actibacterium sp. 188UL27-1]MBM7067759.1 NADH-quinone oxidoreductase subunit E [Actibacterium sp. 188UL27-1]
MLRRLHQEQPEGFAFTPENKAWAEAQMTKYPEGRQASAIIPLLWRAQEQEGWLSRPAIEHVAEMLDLAYIRALEVATFYFMFQLQPVGSVAHIQVCGTTSCMICGAEDLIAVCKDKIATKAHQISEDGKLSWEEVECLGACANAPMAQIGKDYYEDLTTARFGEIIDALRAGEVPTPGPQNGRYAAEPFGGVTSLADYVEGRAAGNASAALAADLGDTVKRIDGTETPILAPWRPATMEPGPSASDVGKDAPEPASKTTDAAKANAPKKKEVTPKPPEETLEAATSGTKPAALDGPRDGSADDLKKIKGVGPKLEKLLNTLGFFHFDQIAAWSEGEVAWVDENLEGFRGRVSRDDWVSQATILATGEETEFSQRAK